MTHLSDGASTNAQRNKVAGRLSFSLVRFATFGIDPALPDPALPLTFGFLAGILLTI